ncbi:bloom syndrome protein homolog [Trichonephila inaurata madagascariensis]|uniref:RecQ-like DNA helicase BLM n=1 Tax=Trichonephila inaurata madagascariensis TaxID=2747483 RepID=A0A8X6Y1D2_9ARAC|nr:bloom syndrome protein homolog [Trichonephila inaurata madagascariensis]
MSCLPFNNLDEHLARFAATKKNVISNQNTKQIKQFTFKKSLSLGKHNSSKNLPFQLNENKTSANVDNTLKKHQDVNKTSNKQGTITSFFSQSEASSKQTNPSNNKNINSSLLNDDFFIDDLNDFIIPCSKTVNKKNSNAVSQDNNSPQNSENSLSKCIVSNYQELSENGITLKQDISTNSKAGTCTFNKNTRSYVELSCNDNSKKDFNHNPQQKDCINSEELIDLEECTSVIFSDEEEIIPCSTRKKNNRRLLSDDESENQEAPKLNDDKECIGNKQGSFVKQHKSESFSIHFSETGDFEKLSHLGSSSLENNDSANISSVLNSLQEMNIEVMTKICDLVQEEKFQFQNKDLSTLLNTREKILRQLEAAKKNSSYSGVLLNGSSVLQPVPFQKLKPGPLFQTKNSYRDTDVNCLENIHNSPRPSFTKLNRAAISFNSTSSESQSLIKDILPVSNKSTSLNEETFSKASYQSGFSKENIVKKIHEINCDNFNSANTTSVHIEDTETQNLIEHSIYDISDDDELSVSGRESLENDHEKIIAGKFYGNQRDDGASLEFKGFNFLFSKDVLNVFHNVFGLKVFRHNQLEAINAALLKEDCFVLMPTGGGKSLCYQLPSLVNNGVTLVVSPLRSLIMDQVQKLNSLDIPAYCLTGDTDTSTSNYIYHQLASREPSIKLLYVTPEKISASVKLVSCMENLYARNVIQRFVIDEAHCVSQWGHDFRPDYKKLKVLREKFPDVPMMALTATATQRVRMDILNQLGMRSPKWFLQSFNRPNLKYEVRAKSKSVVQDIIKLLHTKFKNMCGIVYCLSRNDCDALAAELVKNGITASAYHAGMNNRDEVQESWINDKFKVICATIAFGMGIDKPDVRFVIHHAIPKSIEGYYQESGRAGRDGEHSWCILFYNYKDMHRLKRMIMKDEANKHSWSTHFDNLYRMVYYCENKTDCRRVWMLEYFGEIFDKKLCLNDPVTSCDNCFSKEVFENCDITEDAKAIVQCVAKIVDHRRGKNYTLPYFVDIYKGAKTHKVLAANHDKLELHGKGQHLSRTDAERLLRKLVLDQFLQEDLFINKMDLPITYIYLGKRAKELLSGQIKVTMPLHKGVKNKRAPPAITPIKDKEILQLIEKCYNELIEVSKTIAAERNIHYTNVINVEALRQMSREMPMSEEDMLSIPHVTRVVYEKYGKRFLDVTTKYAAERCVIDAEKADNEMLSALNDDFDNWSDAEPPSTKSNTKKGQKRKRYAQGGPTKKQKTNFWKKKWVKSKAKNSSAQSSSKTKSSKGNKVSTINSTQTSLRAPGFLPMPKCSAKPAIRSFMPAPRVTLI